jgi:hypothetical protein
VRRQHHSSCCRLLLVALLQVPPAVLQHIADGLAIMQGSSSNSSDALPQSWEDQMRVLLADPATQAALNSMALPLDDCTARLRASIHGIVSSPGGGTAAGAASVAGSAADAGTDGVRYIGVAVVEEDQLREQLQQLWQQLEPQRQLAQQAKQQQQQQGLQLEQKLSVGEQQHLAELQLDEPHAKRQRQEQQQQELGAAAGSATFKVSCCCWNVSLLVSTVCSAFCLHLCVYTVWYSSS